MPSTVSTYFNIFQPPARTIFARVTALRSSDAAVPQRHDVEPVGTVGIGTNVLSVVNFSGPQKEGNTCPHSYVRREFYYAC